MTAEEVLLQALSLTSSGRAAEKAVPSMQKFFDKWTLPVLFVLIGGVIGWALWRR
jgi:hypothetical protein